MSVAQHRVLVVHRDRLCGQALAEAVTAPGGMTALEPVCTPVDALAQLHRHPPEVLLIDWDLSAADVAALVQWAKAMCPPPRVIVFGVGDGGAAECARLECDVVPRTAGMKHLHELLARLATTPAPTQTPPPPGLTARQQEIVGLINEGLSNKEIARRLELSLHTVKNHIHAVLTRLNVESRHAAVGILPLRVRTAAPPAGQQAGAG